METERPKPGRNFTYFVTFYLTVCGLITSYYVLRLLHMLLQYIYASVMLNPTMPLINQLYGAYVKVGDWNFWAAISEELSTRLVFKAVVSALYQRSKTTWQKWALGGLDGLLHFSNGLAVFNECDQAFKNDHTFPDVVTCTLSAFAEVVGVGISVWTYKSMLYLLVTGLSIRICTMVDFKAEKTLHTQDFNLTPTSEGKPASEFGEDARVNTNLNKQIHP